MIHWCETTSIYFVGKRLAHNVKTEPVCSSVCPLVEDSSMALKVGSYILIGVGALSMLMGFLGCLGAIYEIRCLLGLVSQPC